MLIMNHIGGLVWHHAAGLILGRSNTNYLTAIRNYHVKERGFDDIGYHAMVFPDGEVLQCRSMMYQGAHVKGRNYDTIGFCFAGNMDLQGPTRKQLRSAIDWTAKFCNCFLIDSNKDFRGHNELANTDCPGRFIDMVLSREMVGTRLDELKINPNSEMGNIELPETCSTWAIPGVCSRVTEE